MLKHIFAALLCLLPFFAQAQENPRAILVLDASGSMWGQIDGKAKITIAQDVIGKLLATLPEDQELGLTVYGHRRKGDCSDIETVIQPGTGTRDAIAAAVNAIKPKGKTPLSAAVIQAAEALKYTEEKATVILISDGRETCELNPCEVGRKLEEAGIDFTAHVIGFDVSNPQDKAELQCLAEETGGTFRTASNAAELADALQVVAEPKPVGIGFGVVEKGTDKIIQDQLIWTLTYEGQTLIDTQPHENSFGMEFLPGKGHVEVLRPEDEAYAELDFTVADKAQKVYLELPKLLPQASIDAPDKATAGSEITVNWSGPNKSGDVIALANPQDGTAEGVANVNIYFYVDQNANNTAQMRLPTTPGIYELRYQTSTGNGDILARKTIKVTEFTFDITAPDKVSVGTAFDVEWKSPTNKGYIITMAKPGDSSNDHVAYLYADQYPDTKATMTASTKPGTYEVRLQDALVHANILARHSIEVSEVEASLIAKDQVEVGETFKVVWKGPNKQISGGGDYIAISEVGSKASSEITYAYTKDSENMTVELVAPVHPGTYEVRYVLNGDNNRVLAKQELVVTPVTATVNFQGPATAGGTLDVSWTGPDRQISGGGDYIALSKPGSKGNEEITYTYTKNSEGNVATIEVPTTPGTYEIRYILNGSDNIILATKEVQVVPVMATLTFASPAPAGGTLTVKWDGPGGDDYLAIAQPGMKVSEEVTYAYLSNSDGDALDIKIPTTPGTYEVRYIQKGNEKKILAAEQLVVEPVSATLEFTSPAPAGGKLAVTWDGPGGDDYLAIAQPGMKVGEEVTYAYVNNSDGNVLEVDIPTTPGTYELRYIQKGNEKKILAAEQLVVEPVKATLEFASPAPAGSKLVVTWDGPGDDDYLAIAQPGMKVGEEVTYAYLSNGDGNTLEIDTPTTPGTYELRYIQKGNERKILAVQELVVEPVKATLEFASPAPAGGKLLVTWDGPGGDDYIAIALAAMGVNEEETYAYLSNSDANTIEIDIPAAPGPYELRYIQKDNERKILAAAPLDVVPMTASLQAADTAARGDTVQVTWEGPAHRRDTIIIAKPGSDSAEAFASVAGGSPATLYAPMVAGDYEIRYIYGPLNKVLATIPLKVE
ncbi:VWA domain-containing protein [Profundibacter sp.]|uniref:VWA domain-containing protein n=1 Tax=Profundibacter sp. TaxID=3101071 RepID=UPI003D0ED8E1